MHAVAYGSLQEVHACVEDGADLSARDTWGANAPSSCRTKW